MTSTTLRLILGDQLNAKHSWFKEKNDDIIYLIAELPQETKYVKHHVQKLCAFFSAMQNFAHALQKAGHRVHHLTLDDTQHFKTLESLIQNLVKKHSITQFQYQRPDEYRLLAQLHDIDLGGIRTEQVDTEHFILPFDDIDQHFKKNKSTRMEGFYRKMRSRFDVLMENKEPLGGQWNFDANNRKSFPAAGPGAIPIPPTFHRDDIDLQVIADIESVLPDFTKNRIP